MVIATTCGGAFMYLVHVPAARFMPEAEYGVFVALLQVLNLMMIPAMGLQTVFAQQCAAAVTGPGQRQLHHVVRWLMVGVAAIWLVMSVVAVAFHHDILGSLKIGNPAALWATIGIGLAMLWLPIMQGLLQGAQNFLWLGWVQILNGCGRFAAVLLIVGLLGGYAAGAMTAALVGFWFALAVAAWHARGFLLGAGEPIAWRPWLGKVIPLTLGLGACQFMVAADMILVQSFFDRDVTYLYGAAGTIGRALVVFTGPMVAVMFPKIVAGVARAERTDVLAQAIGATVLLGGLASLCCTLLPSLPLRVIYASKPQFWIAAPLVPWFAWCMLPLTLANVLVNNLLARARYEAVPWLILVAGTYGCALMWRATHFPAADQMEAFKMIVRTIGTFGLSLLAVSAWFTWGKDWLARAKHREAAQP